MDVQVLSVSSKGQIALPVGIRRNLSIGAGTKLAVYASGDTIMLKVIKIPSVDDFKVSLEEASQWAEKVGYTEDDVDTIIKSVRQRKSL